MADIFVFGDSIGYGAWDEKGGWVDRLKQYFHQKKLANPKQPGTEVYNLAVDGDTSGDVAKRLKSELLARQRPWSSPDDIVLIAIGTNDTYAKDTPDNFRYAPEEFLANLEIIATSAQSVNRKLAFISLDPVDESRTNPTDDGVHYWTNDRIKLFNGTLKKFCSERQLPLLDLFEAQLALPDSKERLFDGLHPNSAGHEWLYEQVRPFILELLA